MSSLDSLPIPDLPVNFVDPVDPALGASLLERFFPSSPPVDLLLFFRCRVGLCSFCSSLTMPLIFDMLASQLPRWKQKIIALSWSRLGFWLIFGSHRTYRQAHRWFTIWQQVAQLKKNEMLLESGLRPVRRMAYCISPLWRSASWSDHAWQDGLRLKRVAQQDTFFICMSISSHGWFWSWWKFENKRTAQTQSHLHASMSKVVAVSPSKSSSFATTASALDTWGVEGTVSPIVARSLRISWQLCSSLTLQCNLTPHYRNSETQVLSRVCR